jgi:hypothetical protein
MANKRSIPRNFREWFVYPNSSQPLGQSPITNSPSLGNQHVPLQSHHPRPSKTSGSAAPNKTGPSEACAKHTELQTIKLLGHFAHGEQPQGAITDFLKGKIEAEVTDPDSIYGDTDEEMKENRSLFEGREKKMRLMRGMRSMGRWCVGSAMGCVRRLVGVMMRARKRWRFVMTCICDLHSAARRPSGGFMKSLPSP